MEGGESIARESGDLTHDSYSFAGRLGGNQLFTLNRSDDAARKFLAGEPDAAPGMSLKEQFDLRPFRSLGIWKAAIIEGVGRCFLPSVQVARNADRRLMYQALSSSSFSPGLRMPHRTVCLPCPLIDMATSTMRRTLDPLREACLTS